MNDMPDPDAIKMFVGQIPKGWNENDVRIHFEEFGRIYLINVLRDKVTKQSRGEWSTVFWENGIFGGSFFRNFDLIFQVVAS